MPSSTWAGVFGMTRTTGWPGGQPASSDGGVDARRERDHEGVGRRALGAISAQQVPHVLGLDHEHHGVAPCHGLDVVESW